MSLLYKIGTKPITAALRDLDSLNVALDSKVDNIFFMNGDLKRIIEAVARAKGAGKGAFVHLDLIKGLSNSDKESVEFIAEYVGADGIVTPKSHLMKEIKKVGLYSVLHLFIIDSLAVKNGLKMIEHSTPDGVEIMPGVVPKSIAAFAEPFEHIPIIASGLIQTKEEAARCLEAGATSLSVSEPSLWQCTFEDFMQIE